MAGGSWMESLVRPDPTAQPAPEPFLLLALCHLSKPAWGSQTRVSERKSFQGASSTLQRVLSLMHVKLLVTWRLNW